MAEVVGPFGDDRDGIGRQRMGVDGGDEDVCRRGIHGRDLAEWPRAQRRPKPRDVDFLTFFLDLTPSMIRKKKKAADSKGAGAITGIWKPDSKKSGTRWRKSSLY